MEVQMMDGKEYFNEIIIPWCQKFKYWAALAVLFGMLTLLKIIGLKVHGGFETPLILLFNIACLYYAFAQWSYSRRAPGWNEVCSRSYGVRPNDKSVLGYLSYKYGGIQEFIVAAAILALSIILMVLFLGG
jgi:hypothetical protein